MEDYEKFLLDNIRKYKKILIMDLTENGINICDWLKGNGKKIRNYVYLGKEPDIRIIEGITVKNLVSLLSWREEALVICVESESSTELSDLNKLGFMNVLIIRNEFVKFLKKEPVYKRNNKIFKQKLQMLKNDRCLRNLKEDILLVTPPAWDMYTPFGAVPCLAAALKQDCVNVAQLDLGILCFHTKLRRSWKEYAGIFESRDFYENTVRRYVDNPYLKFEDYENGIWFFHRDIFPIQEVKEKYYSLNRVQIGVLDLFFQNIANSLSVNIDFNLEKSIVNAVEKFDKNLMIDSIIEMEIKNIICPPAVVGISITGTNQFLSACVLAKIIKYFNPDTQVIVGGSALDVFLFSKYEHKEEILNYFDYLISGEGETSIRMLVRNVLQDGNVDMMEIPNLVRFSDDGEVILPEVFLENVNELPIPCFDGINFGLYLSPQPMIPYQASRGCHYGHCAFCNHNSKYRHNYRTKNMSKVVKELINIKNQYGIYCFQFVDEAIRPDCFAEMIEEMDKYDEFKDTKWIYYSRVSYQYTEELLKKAKRNGCEMVMFGVETFNQRLLKLIRKGIHAETSKYCIKLFSNSGIKTFIWLMSNLPSETIEEMREDIEETKQHMEYLAGIGLGPFYLDINTDMFKNMEDYNIIEYNPYDGTRFVSTNNGKVIDKDKMFEVYGSEYAILPQKYFFTTNRYTIFYENLKEKS